MKKLTILLLILILTGCGSNVNQKGYDLYLKELKAAKVAINDSPYNVSVSFDKLTSDEVVYQIVIDGATKTLSNLKVLVYHDQTTDDVFPSLGIFDGQYNLITAATKEDKVNIRGINLVGYIPFKQDLTKFKMTIKILVMYDDGGKTIKNYHVYNFNK